MSLTTVMYQFAGPVHDTQPWNRAFSYSAGGHAALILLAFLLTMTGRNLPQTVLTEVKFIEQAPAPVPQKRAEEAPPAAGVGHGDGGSPRAMKGKMELNTSGSAPLGTSGNYPTGTGKGPMGASRPLSGPIVTNQPIGWVGRKQGALMEFSHRAGGAVGSGLPGKGADSGPMQEPIALTKMNVDQIRKTEASIGTPLISERVGTGAAGGGGNGLMGSGIGGRGRQLAGAEDELGQKRRTRVESLKDNPLDQEKWGKQGGPFSMEGPLKYRKILRMDLPPYPRWAEEKGIEASISIRLWVDAKGVVKDNMYLEKTSGYSEWDRIAMDALRRFVFVPIPSGQSQDDEWGVATFRFELKH